MSTEREGAFRQWFFSFDEIPTFQATWEAACEWQAARQSAGATGQAPVPCPTCGGGPNTWKCLCEPMWRGYAAPIGDNGAKPKIVRLHASGGTTGYSDFMMSDGSVQTLKVADIQPEDWRDKAQPAESKRVELTFDEIAEVWTGVSCRPLYKGSVADSFARALLARASAKGE